MATPRSHRITSAPARRRHRGSDALQLRRARLAPKPQLTLEARQLLHCDNTGSPEASITLQPAGHRVYRKSRLRKYLLRDGFVARYNTVRKVDGLSGSEGVFLPCSFWLADNYILQGRYDEARRLFVRLLALRNDVGLLAEEYDVCSRRQLGNYPQAFS